MAQTPSSRPAPDEGPPVFRAETNLALIPFQFVPKSGQRDADLRPEDIEIRADGVAQEISLFQGGPLYPRTTPMEVHLLFDCSDSVRGTGALDSRVFRESFLDEYRNASIAIWGFSGTRLILYSRPTRDVERLKWATGEVLKTAVGTTPLYWALARTIASAAAQPGEAVRLVVAVSDGKPVRDRGTTSETIRAARDAGIALYPVVLVSPPPDESLQARVAPENLMVADQRLFASIASPTGGRVFALYADEKREDLLEKVLKRVAVDVRYDYVAGFSPALSGNKERREVKIVLKDTRRGSIIGGVRTIEQ